MMSAEVRLTSVAADGGEIESTPWLRARSRATATKIGTLRAIAHNIVDLLGTGIDLLIGVYEMDIFGEASKSPDGFIRVDFLTGEVTY